MNPIVELQHVTKRYDQAPSDSAVLRDVCLTVDSGQSAAILGVSGSGKTTLLNIIGMLDVPTSGQVRLAGQDVLGLDDAQTAQVRNRQVGFVFQMHHLLPQLTVLENVLLPVLAGGGRADAGAKARAEALLERLGLEPRMSHRPGQLSGGEQQRTAVARALINQPQLLLADEPTGSLDAASRENLSSLLVDLNRTDGLTLIVVTHSLELARRMGRVYQLRDGRLHSTPEGGLQA